MRLKARWQDRRNRAEVYSTASYWDRKARELQGEAVSMWPNNALNGLYHREQVELLDRVLGDPTGASILDVGCGTGRMSRHLAARGATVTGIDFAAEAVALARAASAGDNPMYRVQSLFDLQDDGVHDVVISWGTIAIACRTRDDLDAALTRLHRALKPGGRMILLEPVHRGFVQRVLPLDAGSFAAAMEGVGLTVEEVVEMHFWPARFALAYVAWPPALTRVGYRIGQLLLTVPGLRHLGDYKAFVARRLDREPR